MPHDHEALIIMHLVYKYTFCSFRETNIQNKKNSNNAINKYVFNTSIRSIINPNNIKTIDITYSIINDINKINIQKQSVNMSFSSKEGEYKIHT